MRILVKTGKLAKADWLLHRTRGIGGSDAGAVCGLNPYVSPIDVYLEKTGRKEPPGSSEAMRQGNDFESYVAGRFEEATGKKVRRKNAILMHDKHDFMLANIDREVIGENAILECKTASVYASESWADGKIPEHYEIQCHHYMAVTGAEKCYLACLILNKEFIVREIVRDEEVTERLIGIEKNFWEEYVLKDRMPPPDGSEAATDTIRMLYRDSDAGEAVNLFGFTERLARYAELEELTKKLGEEKEQIRQEIMLEMKEAETAFSGAVKITWKTARGRSAVDAKRLKADRPEIYEAYLKRGDPFRVFKIHKEEKS
jgi:putative phage-type endonuclease